MGICFEFANRDRLHEIPFGRQESVCDHVLEHSKIDIFQMLKMTSQKSINRKCRLEQADSPKISLDRNFRELTSLPSMSVIVIWFPSSTIVFKNIYGR